MISAETWNYWDSQEFSFVFPENQVATDCSGFSKQICSVRLIDNRLCRFHVHSSAFSIKEHGPRNQCEECVVTAHSNINSWMPLRSALSRKYVARDYWFSAKFLDAQSLSV
jgi:hypothetical protein